MNEKKPLFDETWVFRDRQVRDETDSTIVTDHDVEPSACRLIAAAPELYRALAALEWSTELGSCPTCGSQPGDDHDFDCALGLALRKARGE